MKSLPDYKADESYVKYLPASAPYDTRAGVVVGAHGVQGTVKVKPVTGTSSKLFTPPGRGVGAITVWLGPDDDNGKIVEIVSAKRQEPKDIYLVRIRNVDDRTSAEKLVGQSICGKSEDRENLSEDEYFVEDLIGMAIVDRSNHNLGHLTVVHSGVANDVYETDQGVMIPAVKAFIDKIDLADRKIIVVDATALVME